ncbi:MAG: hypothetical protein IJP86_06070 [Synergistaceae bacterium]|nr:hypothetical protein [Synergistaceae bacterium]
MAAHTGQAGHPGGISYPRLVLEAVPEIFIFQFMTWLLLSAFSWGIDRMSWSRAALP